MTTPDISNHNPDPAYLRGLIEQAGLSQREAARLTKTGKVKKGSVRIDG